MKIYCLRDRLIDYWMQPFAGPDHKSVMAAIARTVNEQGATLSDIQSAPHQFEIWQLGIVTEDGHLTPEREYVADCASLIRSRVRPGEQPHQPEAPNAAHTGSGEAPEGRIRAHTNGGPVSHPLATAAREAEEVLQGPRGGYPPRGE